MRASFHKTGSARMGLPLHLLGFGLFVVIEIVLLSLLFNDSLNAQASQPAAGTTPPGQSSGTVAGQSNTAGQPADNAADQLIKSHPLYERFKQGERYFFEGKDELALLIFDQIAGQFPKNARLHLYRGDIYLKIEEFKKARLAYGAAMAADPEMTAQACLGIGRAWYLEDDGKKAATYLKAAYQADSKLIEALFYSGLNELVARRDRTAAIKEWEAYLKLSSPATDPQYASIQKIIALLKDKNFSVPTKKVIPSRKQFLEFLAAGGKLSGLEPPKPPGLKATGEEPKTNNTSQTIIQGDSL